MKKELISSYKCFGGTVEIVRHESLSTATPMTLSVFIPPQKGPYPVLTWLSGLTCNHENFTTKSGAYKKASDLGMMIVAPDTSPRGESVANDDAYDMGQGAGFYLIFALSAWV